MSGPDGSQRAGSFDSTLSPNYSLRRNGLLSPREVRHERQKLLPPCSVALRHYCRAAIHPCRWRVAGSGQRDNLSSSVGKLDCLRGYHWTCVDRLRRITPGLSGARIDRPAQMRQGISVTKISEPQNVAAFGANSVMSGPYSLPVFLTSGSGRLSI